MLDLFTVISIRRIPLQISFSFYFFTNQISLFTAHSGNARIDMDFVKAHKATYAKKTKLFLTPKIVSLSLIYLDLFRSKFWQTLALLKKRI
jgi:hypothetical protein